MKVASLPSDRQVAQTAAQHLLKAVKAAHDPQLKSNLSQALAAIHKYLAHDQAPKVNAKSVVKANEAKPSKK